MGRGTGKSGAVIGPRARVAIQWSTRVADVALVRLSGAQSSPSLARPLASLAETTRLVQKAAERLATGKRINRAADDPAGMIAADALRVREREIERTLQALDFNSARLSAVEAGKSVVQDLLVELEGHLVAAANTGGLSEEERQAHQDQADQILAAIDFLGQTATFNGQAILQDVSAAQLGRRPVTDPQTGEEITVSLADLSSGGRLGLAGEQASLAQEVLRGAIGEVATARGGIGIAMRDIDSRRRTLLTEYESVAGERSRIEDADVALETAELIRAQALQSAAGFMARFAMEQQSRAMRLLLGPVR
jgi:flagellin